MAYKWNLDLFQVVGKDKQNIPPSDGLMAIYHGRK